MGVNLRRSTLNTPIEVVLPPMQQNYVLIVPDQYGLFLWGRDGAAVWGPDSGAESRCEKKENGRNSFGSLSLSAQDRFSLTG